MTNCRAIRSALHPVTESIKSIFHSEAITT